MAKKAPAQSVDPAEIPEVVEFMDAQRAIQEFKEMHADVFKDLDGLVERHNTALEQADKVCRARQVSCGPFDLYQFTTKYDAEALFNAVGRDTFLEIGGKLETVTKYEVDKGKLEACIAQKKVDKEVAERVRKDTPAFHKPQQLVLP